ncbi:MAG: hypothetical protein H6679_00935 [Epsilonproteobacteria bacterium]|nr:hypothetical protein [Campylobacterota bacterium]
MNKRFLFPVVFAFFTFSPIHPINDDHDFERLKQLAQTRDHNNSEEIMNKLMSNPTLMDKLIQNPGVLYLVVSKCLKNPAFLSLYMKTLGIPTHPTRVYPIYYQEQKIELPKETKKKKDKKGSKEKKHHVVVSLENQP